MSQSFIRAIAKNTKGNVVMMVYVLIRKKKEVREERP